MVDDACVGEGEDGRGSGMRVTGKEMGLLVGDHWLDGGRGGHPYVQSGVVFHIHIRCNMGH